MPDKKEGIENFIINKLEKAHTLDEIRSMLKRAGFSKSEIEVGIANVKEKHKTFHQDIVASNSFLPSLKKLEKFEQKIEKDIKKEEKIIIREFSELGLFAGRIRRKDFIVSIVFLFSLLFSITIVVASFVDALSPKVLDRMREMFAPDKIHIMFLFLPILFAPFTLFFLSLVTRRLHDLDLPGILSFLYLFLAIYPFSNNSPKGMVVFDIALFIFFLFLLLQKGIPEKNKHGKSPAAHGSTFTKLLNLK